MGGSHSHHLPVCRQRARILLVPSGDTFPLLEDLGVIREFDLAGDSDFS